ncbi:hypothetical protein QQ73_00620 [Candidatus Endoriftia persephone str. Guaymas]|nr:hypothetical protein [Candidatus Endoriftia persephone str. Guaymas]
MFLQLLHQQLAVTLPNVLTAPDRLAEKLVLADLLQRIEQILTDHTELPVQILRWAVLFEPTIEVELREHCQARLSRCTHHRSGISLPLIWRSVISLLKLAQLLFAAAVQIPLQHLLAGKPLHIHQQTLKCSCIGRQRRLCGLKGVVDPDQLFTGLDKHLDFTIQSLKLLWCNPPAGLEPDDRLQGQPFCLCHLSTLCRVPARQNLIYCDQLLLHTADRPIGTLHRTPYRAGDLSQR